MEVFKIYNIFYLVLTLLGIGGTFATGGWHFSLIIILFISYIFVWVLGLCAQRRFNADLKDESKTPSVLFHIIVGSIFLLFGIAAIAFSFVYNIFYFGFLTISQFVLAILSVVEILLSVLLIKQKKALLLPQVSSDEEHTVVSFFRGTMKTFVLFFANIFAVATSGFVVYYAFTSGLPTFINVPLDAYGPLLYSSNIIERLLQPEIFFCILVYLPLFILSIITLGMVIANKCSSKKYKLFNLIISIGLLGLCAFAMTTLNSVSVVKSPHTEEIYYYIISGHVTHDFLLTNGYPGPDIKGCYYVVAFFIAILSIYFNRKSVSIECKKYKTPISVIVIVSFAAVVIAVFLPMLLRSDILSSNSIVVAMILLFVFCGYIIFAIIKKENIKQHLITASIGGGLISMALILLLIRYYRVFTYCSNSFRDNLRSGAEFLYSSLNILMWFTIIFIVLVLLIVVALIVYKIKGVKCTEFEPLVENKPHLWPDRFSILFRAIPIILTLISFDFIDTVYDVHEDLWFSQIGFAPMTGIFALLIVGLCIDMLYFHKNRIISKIANIVLGLFYIALLIVFVNGTTSAKFSYVEEWTSGDETFVEYHDFISYTYIHLIVFACSWVSSIVIDFIPEMLIATAPIRERNARLKAEKQRKKEEQIAAAKAKKEEERRLKQAEEARRLEQKRIEEAKRLEQKKKAEEAKKQAEIEKQKKQKVDSQRKTLNNTNSKIDQLKSAKELFDSGVINEEEFNELKQEILGNDK